MPHIAGHVASPLVPPSQPGIAGFGKIIQQQAAAAGPAELQRLRDQFSGNTQALSFLNRGAAGPGGGVQFFSDILGQQAAAGGQQFNQNVAAGQFADNPLAQQVINQNLLASGQTFTGNQIRDFTPQEQSGVDFFTAAQDPGFQNVLSGIVETRATNQDPEFLKAVREGFFIDNPEAIAAANRGLRPQGLQIVNGQVVELTGLGGSTQTIEEGEKEAIDILTKAVDTARGDITGSTVSALAELESGRDVFDPFLQSGVGADQQQAALSGALGAEAQAAAIAAFQDSPEQQFLREQGRREILATAAATGGLGGGEVQRELTRFGTGLAAQDFQNRFNRLGQVAGRGFQAATGTADLFGRGANIQSEAGINLAGTALKGGFGRADITSRAAEINALNRFSTGINLADAFGGFARDTADLFTKQGAGISDILGAGGVNVANVLTNAGIRSAADQQQFLALLANVTVGSGASQISGAQFLENGGTIDELAALSEGVGTLISAFTGE